MGEPNFYSYLYANSDAVAFDEASENIDLSDAASVQLAFKTYLSDFKPPLNITSELLEENFYRSPNEGNDGNMDYLRYDIEIPGVDEKIDLDALTLYFEDFLEQIGVTNEKGNVCGVEVDALGNERGGEDISIYIFFGGDQIEKGKNHENKDGQKNV